MIIKCFLICDQAETRDSLTGYIERTGTLALEGSATIDEISTNMDKILADVIFVDAHNFQFLKDHIPGNEKAPVFICTHTEEIHGSSSSLHSVLFLNSSNLSFESFLNIINTAIIQLLDPKPSVNHKDENYFFIKSEYRIIKINFNDIIFCEGLKDYTQIFTSKKNKPIITLQNLKTFSDRLPAKKFVRIHRSFIVSLNHIDSISKKEVEIGEKILPIGNSYRNNLLDIVRLNS